MKQLLAPYARIGKVLLSSLDFKSSRVFYFVVLSINAIPLIAAGFTDMAVHSLLWNAPAITLILGWVWVAILLLSLNHPHQAQLVPNYVKRLRIAALVSWIVASLGAALIASRGQGNILFFINLVAAVMVLLVTPFRWPVGWGISVFALAAVVKYDGGSPILPIAQAISESQVKAAALELGFLMFLGLLVTRMYSVRGSNHALLFGQQAGKKEIGETLVVVAVGFPKTATFLAKIERWLMLPARLHGRWLLRHGASTPQSVIARAEHVLGYLPWSMHLCMVVVVMLLVLVFSVSHTSWTIAAVCVLMTVAVGQLGLHEPMLRTTREQQLLLLLPGMPRGSTLNRMLAMRHLLQVSAAWIVATSLLLFMPTSHEESETVFAMYIAMLMLLPLAIQDWAIKKPLTGYVLLSWLLSGAASVTFTLLMLHWLHMPIVLIFAIGVGIAAVLLRLQWVRLKTFAQAFPAGRLHLS